MVYQGVDLTTNLSVALKVMSLKDGKATVPIKGVRREIEYAASVQHENVVKLVDFVADSDQIVIVWELIQGSDLLDLLNEKGGRLEESEAAGYFAQLLKAVEFIHAHGLCHRDLKPENCMVERGTNKLKIIDFGLSKHQQSAVTLGVGTPDYMAPELLGAGNGMTALHERQVGHYDARACDVWAMGVLLYLLVTGQYPFEDPKQPQNVVATLQNIAQGRMRPLPKRISSECGDIIGKMLKHEAGARITLEGLWAHPWLRSSGGGAQGAGGGVMVGSSSGGGGGSRDDDDVATTAAKNKKKNESFTFVAPPEVPSKPTPITPKVLGPLMPQQNAAASSPTVSAPHAVDAFERKNESPAGGEGMGKKREGFGGAGGEEEEKKKKKTTTQQGGAGFFCRMMWFGGGKG